MTDQTRAETWLRQLGWTLASLPHAEREEILRETRSHIEDRMAAGAPVDRILEDFGPADRHARRFIDEIQVYEVIGSQRARDLAGFIANRAHRNLAAAATLLALLLLGIAAIVTLGLAGLELYDPVRNGVWIGDGGGVFIGLTDMSASGREILGAWLYPVAALVLTAICVSGRLLLSLVVPLLARTSDLPRRHMS